MENISQYIGVTLALCVLVWGMVGFFRGLSLVWTAPAIPFRAPRDGRSR